MILKDRSAGGRKPILRSGPVVCCVQDAYQILVPVNVPVLMSVIVGDTEYVNHVGGVRVSDAPVQRFTVPQAALDAAGAYTLVYTALFTRGAYSCRKGRTARKTYSFSPVPKDGEVRAYVVADSHGRSREAVAAASFFGEGLDLLILNGDIAPQSETADEALMIFDVAYAVTGGRVPCILTRGNHELRGAWAAPFSEMLPNADGRLYYTVRLGPLRFVVLDCGEDKPDDNREYSGTAAFHTFRLEETAFLERFAREEAAAFADGARHRLVLSHIPFTRRDHGEFDIEDALYTRWAELLNDAYAPQLYIAGHLHRTALYDDGTENERGLRCPLLIAGRLLGPKETGTGAHEYIGAALTFRDGGVHIAFTDKNRQIVAERDVSYN